MSLRPSLLQSLLGLGAAGLVVFCCRVRTELRKIADEEKEEEEELNNDVSDLRMVDVNASYEVGRKITDSAFGIVYRAARKIDGTQVFLKKLNKAGRPLGRTRREPDIQRSLDHPAIAKVFDVFQDDKALCMDMEALEGGELFSRIIEAGCFTEAQAKILMTQILSSVAFLHDNFICHRDIKPESFMFATKDRVETAVLKLAEFGCARKFTPGQVLKSKTGTPYYIAPQILAGEYDNLCDLWSCGVVMYVMHVGYPPFFGETDADVLAKVRLGNYSFITADWKKVSENSKSLVRTLLTMNPPARGTAREALNHAWFAQ